MPKDNPYYKMQEENSLLGKCKDAFNTCKLAAEKIKEEEWNEFCKSVIKSARSGNSQYELDASMIPTNRRNFLIKRFKEEGFSVKFGTKLCQKDDHYKDPSVIIISGWSD